MELHIKSFHDLTPGELYAIMQLRVAVFMVEQQCSCTELDDRDQAALHLFLTDETGIQAYLRILDRGIAGAHVAIGRVIAARRRCGLGTRIMKEAIRVARERLGADVIYIEAQSYAREMYEKLGFRQISDEFLEGGIPHVEMILPLPDAAGAPSA